MKIILTSIFSCIIFAGFTQTTNCPALQAENIRLQKLLQLYSNPKKDTVNNVEFTFFNATGNIKNKTVTIEVLVKNIGTIHRKIDIDKIDVIDEGNNSHEDRGAHLGNDHYFGFVDMLSLTPKKFVATIKNVVPESMSYVKNVTFKFRDFEDAFIYFNIAISGDKVKWK